MSSKGSVEKALSWIETDPSRILGLDIGSHTNVQPGEYVSREDARSAPGIYFPNLSLNATYIVVALDIDAPFPSFKFLSPILHWLQPGLQPTKSEEGPELCHLKSASLPLINYIPPGPPPWSSPHRYIFFLYEQPARFEETKHASPDGQKSNRWNRIRFDLDAWEKEHDMGPILAVNYFESN